LILYEFEKKEVISVYQFVNACMYLISFHFRQGMKRSFPALLMAFIDTIERVDREQIICS